MNKELDNICQEINKIQSTNLLFVQNEIDYIIKSNIIDEKIIEHAFDRLLDLCFWYGNDLNKLYYKFIDYYKKINLEASKEYEELYLKILKDQ